MSAVCFSIFSAVSHLSHANHVVHLLIASQSPSSPCSNERREPAFHALAMRRQTFALLCRSSPRAASLCTHQDILRGKALITNNPSMHPNVVIGHSQCAAVPRCLVTLYAVHLRANTQELLLNRHHGSLSHRPFLSQNTLLKNKRAERNSHAAHFAKAPERSLSSLRGFFMHNELKNPLQSPSFLVNVRSALCSENVSRRDILFGSLRCNFLARSHVGSSTEMLKRGIFVRLTSITGGNTCDAWRHARDRRRRLVVLVQCM